MQVFQAPQQHGKYWIEFVEEHILEGCLQKYWIELRVLPGAIAVKRERDYHYEEKKIYKYFSVY